MGFGRWYNSQKAGVQAAVVSGIVVIVGGVIAGVFGIVDVELAKPGAQISASAPAPTSTTPASTPVITTSSRPASNRSPLVSIPVSVPYCNTFRVHGVVPSNKVLLLFDRFADKSNVSVQGHIWDFDRAAISTSNGWVFKDVEIGNGIGSDNGDHHEIAIVLIGQAEYPAFKSPNGVDLPTLPGKIVQDVYVVRNSNDRPCPN